MVATPLPPGPKAHFLTGHLSSIRGDLLGFLSECARVYGDVVPLRFGPLRAVLLSHPAMIEEVLVTHQADFVKGGGIRRRRARSLVGNGIGVSDGALWRRQRRLMQPAFRPERVAGYGEVIVDAGQRMLANWRHGEERDILAAMMQVALDVVCRTLFTADVSGELAEIGEACETVQEHFRSRLTTLLFLLPDALPTPGNLRYQRAVRRIDQTVYRLMAQRRAASRVPSAGDADLLTTLLDAQHEPAHLLTDRQVRDEVVTLMLAGHQTTALALTWTWYLLARHPGVEARLMAELQDVLGGRPPRAADVPRLPYARRIVMEALRLYPPGVAVTRETARACEIAGYCLPARTAIIMSQWVTQRDPRFFAEPEAFRPERWEGGLEQRLPRFAYFPFGGGLRLCIGSAFATTEVVLLLACIAQRYQLSLAPGYPVVPHVAYTLRPMYGLRMVLHRR